MLDVRVSLIGLKNMAGKENEEWVKALKKIKEDTERQVSDISLAEKQLREKYEEGRKRLIDLILSEFRKVGEIFKDPTKAEADQPKVEGGDWGACLSVPIVLLALILISAYAFV